MKGWHQILQANDAMDYALALGIMLGVWIALAIAKYAGARAIAHVAQRAESRWGGIFAEVVRATSLVLLLPVAIYAGATVLDVPSRLEHFVEHAAVVALLLQAGLWVHRYVGRWVAHKLEFDRQREPEGATALSLLAFGARVAVWSIVLLLTLNQLNFDITALIAGLGVGGVAVALATQNILGDLFASLSIVLDKPFIVGDFIVVDNLRGEVERVGIKTTRVRSLDGELLVFSNGDLLKSRIHNYRRMRERRILFTVGVTYQTPLEQVKRIPQWLREAVEGQQRTRFDRAHFKEYGDSALAFEVVYFVLDGDYNLYMDIQQAINLAIYEKFSGEGIDFAYPTRTLYVHGAAGK